MCSTAAGYGELCLWFNFNESEKGKGRGGEANDVGPLRIRLLYHLAYGGWARSAIGSQNFGVLTKRYDNSAFFFAANKNKNSAQVPLASTSS